MRTKLLEILACPSCGGSLRPHFDVPEDEEVMEGTLECEACDAEYPVTRGVPRMNWSMDGLENVARTFGYEWKAHHEGRLEADTVFGRDLAGDWKYFLEGTGMQAEQLRGAVVLDAGCGSGRLTGEIAKHGASLVVGLDVNEAVDEAYDSSRNHPNVHIVQGNIFALPLRERAFDLVWSNGVIHHTPDAARGHSSLSRVVKPGGRLYVWVYPRRFNPFRFVKDVFDWLRVSRLPEHALLAISKLISYPSLGLLWLYRGARKVPLLRPRTAWGWRTVRSRGLRELQLTWFDALSPEFDSRHTEQEVVGWFRREGFESICALEEPKVGVRGVLADRNAE